ncbi:Isochorismatase hydrolase [Hypomontagnella monticulosa]|nr:Isochorismatase hydrolase [Hypomontagnella monticulosa]
MPGQQSTGGDFTFGKSYAVLHLDLMTCLIDAVANTSEGKAFVSNCVRWNEAVHKKDPQPPTIFTSLFFNPGEPELAVDAPFTRLLQDFGPFAVGTPPVQISSHFATQEKDIVLQKTRWYAGAGNNLEQILRARNIDTVILSGLSLSGVVMSTVYRLFDLDYTVYVISDNVLELPPHHHQEYSQVLLRSLMPKMNLKVISIEQALGALERS